jgi:hypothetical protein
MAARYGELDAGLRGPGAGDAYESAAAPSSASKPVNALLSICSSERDRLAPGLLRFAGCL